MKMSANNKRIVAYRRKRESKTNYNKRLNLLKARKPRMVIRKSLKYITANIVNYEAAGDKVVISTTSKELTKLGWNYNKKNMPSAYLTGFMMAKKALKQGIKEAIVDLGMNLAIPGNKLYAVVKG
ncbi:MAG: 50S ribosomal protein L18, partial [Minisyncoccales bacterium]